MVMAERILKSFWTITVLACCCLVVGQSSTCDSRRCLADELINKKLFSPPQSVECGITVNLVSIQYETLSVDTKALRFSSRIKIVMKWTDPELAWENNTYDFEEVIVPVDKIWTPDLTVDNAIQTEVKPLYTDTLVRQDGTVEHSILMYTTVVCGINLFNYPFVQDACPIALNGWSEKNCGLQFTYGNVSSVGASRGEWKTVSVELRIDKQNPDRNYLYVTMSINPFNTIVTLILPSTLIMLTDLVSFALPLDGGKRSSFKVTLVLSFTMSLIILTDHLPDTGTCSPLIRYHYCFCLVVLVSSLLSSMVCTRLAEHGRLILNTHPKSRALGKDEDDGQKDINLNGVGTVSADMATKDTSIQKIATYLENREKDNRETKRKIKFANKFDMICFCTFLCIDIFYVLCLIAVTRTEFCKINNLDFWN